ncbi:MAG: NADPH:quinone reductase-like Zn-dependent oxidoreductase [Myxococcota bacterium]|jgi:NADPH:quinone reductase-like Zn-dependent oxidoreductase
MSRVVVARGKGGPEVLHVEQRAVPEPKPAEVCLRVNLAGVAFGDVMRRRGVLAPPWSFTPGYDVVGTVDARGDTAEVSVGQRVAAFMPGPGFGGYADHVCVHTDRLVAVPDGVDDATAIGLGLNYVTAYQLIHRFLSLERGDSVLVHGAAGGVGTAMLDLGALHGLTLFGTASAGKHSALTARGCTPIDYRSEDFVERMASLAPDGVNAVVDGIGGAHLRRSAAVLAPGGGLAALGVSGDLSGGWLGVAAGFRHLAALRLSGVNARMYAIGQSRGCGLPNIVADWGALLQHAVAGEVTPVIGATVPLDQVAEAHRLLDESAVVGKVLLDCR